MEEGPQGQDRPFKGHTPVTQIFHDLPKLCAHQWIDPWMRLASFLSNPLGTVTQAVDEAIICECLGCFKLKPWRHSDNGLCQAPIVPI